MQKITTPNLIPAFIYDELSAQGEAALMQALAVDEELCEELEEGMLMKQKLSEIQLEPHPSSVAYILAYSARTTSVEHV